MRHWIGLGAALLVAHVSIAVAQEEDEETAAQDATVQQEAAQEDEDDVWPPWRRKQAIPSPITDRFALRGLYFRPEVKTELRLDSGELGTAGTLLSAEDDMGLDDELNQGRLELMFRLTERGRVRADYFKANRRGDKVLERAIFFGEESFNVNERIVSSLDWRMLNLTYVFSPLKRERVEIGVGPGVHLLQAEAIADVPARLQREEASGIGVFPTVAVDGAWRVTRRFALTARGQYFSASVDTFDGSLADYHADVQFRWRSNFAIGLGYSIIKAKLDVADEEFPGRFVLDVKGPEAFIRASF